MTTDSDHVWALAGYAMWVVGSLLFAIVAFLDDDPMSLAASLLFLFGVIAVMVPLARHLMSDEDPAP